MNCCDIYVKVDGLFQENLSVDVLERFDKNLLVFCDMQGKMYEISAVKEMLAHRIKEAEMGAKEERKGLHVRRLNNGRFSTDNVYAEKFLYAEEEIYMLYLLCCNMEDVANLLGSCRQTVSRKIRQYKEKRFCCE